MKVTLREVQLWANTRFVSKRDLRHTRDERFGLADTDDDTKKGIFELSGITTETTRTLTWPDESGTVALEENVVANSEWLQNGFVDASEVSLSWDDASMTLTVDAVGASFRYYHDGILYTVSSADTALITDVDGTHVIYYDGATLTVAANPSHAAVDSVIENECIVASVIWDATSNDGRLIPELHGYRMSPSTHHWLHDNMGAQYANGMALSDFVSDGNGSSNTHAQFSVASGEFYDEDIGVDLSAVVSTTGLEVWYLDGANWRWTTNSGYSVLTTGTGRLAYNNSGAQTEVGNVQFVLCHVYATNITADDGTSPKYLAIQGQATYANKAAARTGAETEINNLTYGDFPLEEAVPVGTVIFQTATAYSNAVKGRVVTTDAGDDWVDWRHSSLKATGGSIADHGSLAGLSDDDHSQYKLLVGRAAEDEIILGWLGIGAAGPVQAIHIQEGSSGAAGIQCTNDTTGHLISDGLWLGLDADENVGIWNNEAGTVYLGTSNVARLTIDASGDTTIADGNKIITDQVRAYDAAGLKLYEDGGKGIFVEDSTGHVGVGTAAPTRHIQVHESSSSAASMGFTNDTTGALITDGMSIGLGADEAGYVLMQEAASLHLGTSAVTKMTIDSAGRVGIATSGQSVMLAVDQESTTGAIPVLRLDQADTSEEFIDFWCSGTGAGRPVDEDTAVGAAFARLRVAVNGTFKYIQLYDA